MVEDGEGMVAFTEVLDALIALNYRQNGVERTDVMGSMVPPVPASPPLQSRSSSPLPPSSAWATPSSRTAPPEVLWWSKERARRALPQTLLKQ